MTAVGQYLFGNLSAVNPKPCVQPPRRLCAFKKEAGEDQRLGIGEEVVAQQMPFDPILQPPGLGGQAV